MGNLWTVLTSPTATFERLRENRVLWLPMIVLIVLSAIAFWLQAPAFLGDMEKELAKQDLPAEAVEGARMVGQASMAFTAALMVPISTFVFGAILLLVNLIVRGEAQYMQLATVGLYSYVPAVISLLITGVLVRVTGATSIYDVGLNLGSLMTEKTGFLYHILTFADPFGIWSLVLMVIGTAVMAARPRKQVATWIAVGYVVICLVAAVLAAAGDKMSGV